MESEINFEEITEKEKKLLSEKQKEIEKYADDLRDLMNFIYFLSFESSKIPKEDLREMNKREIMEESYGRGIESAIIFLAMLINPKILHRAFYQLLKLTIELDTDREISEKEIKEIWKEVRKIFDSEKLEKILDDL